MIPHSPWSVIRREPQTIDELAALKKAHGLICLYALQQWEAFAPNYQRPLDASYFYKNQASFHAGLNNTTRQTALKHLATQTCFVCTAAVPLERTQGDHLIAWALGGTDSLQNAVLLCRRCNSSKGTKDLLQWWREKSYPVATLPRNVLCLYCRVHWQHYADDNIRVGMPSAMAEFLCARAALLPSDAHRIALVGMAHALVASLLYEKEPPRYA